MTRLYFVRHTFVFLFQNPREPPSPFQQLITFYIQSITISNPKSQSLMTLKISSWAISYTDFICINFIWIVTISFGSSDDGSGDSCG
ncbi:hypothetical protein HanPI659440_Chr16g0652691 [Helianthus annuus]|nr:hypothetical protein HanPI659440_Chr16g0652691 [Helianthus annuus]